MAALSSPVIVLSGAGGGSPDLDVFRAGSEDSTRFEVIEYPEWKSYMADGFSAEVLIGDIVDKIAKKIPRGPIRIIGVSIGAHFGYAAALRLRAMGRDIGGLCAIDSFMIASAAPSVGWKRRALSQAFQLLSEHRFGEFAVFLRSRFWRAISRAAGAYLPSVLRSSTAWLPSVLAFDPMFEGELNMRLLIRETAPWIASLDRRPIALEAPVFLLRTSLAAHDDDAWRRRCPHLRIFEIPGQHHTLFDAENAGVLHKVFVDASRDWREASQSLGPTQEL